MTTAATKAGAKKDPHETDVTRPKLIVAIGRQRVGKTTLLKAVTEISRSQGANPEIWNTDMMNKSHAIDVLGGDVFSPTQSSVAGQAKWLEQRILDLSKSGRDAVLDIGGGWTAVHELIQSAPLLGTLRRLKVDLVMIFVIGAEEADLDYLDDLYNRGFNAPRSAVVINEGLLPQSADSDDVLKSVIAHAGVQRTLKKGGRCVFFPAINGLKQITERKQTFTDYAAGKSVPGLPEPSIFDVMRAQFWLLHDLPEFMHDLGPEFLPSLPNGLPRIWSQEEVEEMEDV
ncbi:FAD-binding oxidoreductase [Acetobacter sp. UBA5411]|uniref:FAD-binding oxidoreductase n=1 Tax=Acetobacter sp. UBA5411 TaxID=1945905 RepID=UPI0025C54200|nr:FAD-binding oxidoreductase [Acetobacter sp. UBA5411]